MNGQRPQMGALFAQSHSYGGPDVFRVVGYTPQRIIAERVPVLSATDAPPVCNSHHRINEAWLAANPPPAAPLRKRGSHNVLMQWGDGEDEMIFLRYEREFYFPVTALERTRGWESVEY
jgi:hypothetical protein